MSKPTRGRAGLWIVQGPDVVSGKLRLALEDHGIRQVEQVATDAVVLEMTKDRAEQLRAEFPALIVEADSDLEPLR